MRFWTTSCSGELFASCASVAQLACRNRGRKSPLASWTENSVRALWSSQASHHRYPCSVLPGLYPSMFPKWLSTLKTFDRFEVAGLSLTGPLAV